MLDSFWAAAIQMDTRLFDRAFNLAAMQAQARDAKRAQPALKLLVFPELCSTGYACAARFSELAEPAGGESMQALGALAQELDCCIAYGFALREQGRIYNAAAFLDSTGVCIGLYRKTHLFDLERDWFSAGESLPVFDTPLGRVGLLICWDLSFPEAARALALNGATLLVTLSAWEYPFAGNYTMATRMRAYENCLPLIASNRVGQEPVDRFIGHSSIYAAGGELLAQLPEGQLGAAIAQLQPEEYVRLREEVYPFLKYRRNDLYDSLVSK